MHRIGPLPLLLGGFLVVSIALLLGIDMRRAARRGPRWRRRLIGAGLATLAAIGLLPAAEASPRSAGERLRVLCAGDEDLAGTEEWKSIEATWAEAEEVASGKRGDYPFDQAGKDRLLGDLKKTDERIGALVQRGLLSESEAGLLRKDRDEMKSGVEEKRPKEMENATCYEGMALPVQARLSFQDLSTRLPLIEGIVKDGKVHPAAAKKVLVSVEADLAVLSSDAEMAKLPAEERPDAEKMRDAVKAGVEAIHKLIDAQGSK